MKKLLLSAALICAGMFGTSDAMAQKLGHINSQAVMVSMPEYKAAQKAMDEYAKTFQTQFAEMAKELETKFAKFQNEGQTYSDAIREQKQKELQNLNAQIETFSKESEEKLAKKEEALMKPIIEKAKKAITDLCVEQQYDYIFEGSNLIHARESDDITEKVKAKLASMAPAASTTTATKPATTKPAGK